jgi:ribose transport system substrate-binding protein
MRRKAVSRSFLSAMLLALLGLVLAFGVTACGSSGSSSSEPSSTTASAEEEPAGGEGEEGAEAEASGEDASGESFGGAKSLAELYKGNQELPPSSGPAAQKGKFVAWVSCGQISPGCSIPAAGFQEAAKALGWKSQVIDGKENENNGLSVGIRDAIALHPDAIGMVGNDCPVVRGALEEAKKANIPVFGYESFDCNEIEGSEGEPSLFSIPGEYSKTMKTPANFFETWGSMLTEYIIDKTEGKAKILYLTFPAPLAESWKVGSDKALEKCGECEIVEEMPAAQTELASQGLIGRKLETALLKNQEANGVQFNLDVAALSGGGAKAVADSGRQGELTVSSGEGSIEANELIRSEGGITDGLGLPLNWLGWASADEINRYFAGEPASPEGIGFQVIDKEHNLPEAGENYTPEVDYKSAYEKVWGGS